ncbi:hypothetical protein ACQP0C_02490 [Nocardia sp. CA-129566]|uniref:hypothetical protein n=1 Tax=Nocardia sp. CA-129566 TaxID=3239976 RepID=UPI003D982D3D
MSSVERLKATSARGRNPLGHLWFKFAVLDTVAPPSVRNLEFLLFPNIDRYSTDRAVTFIARHLQQQAYYNAIDCATAPVDIGKISPLSDISVYSQNNEDGIILAILKYIGHGNRRLLDIGCGNPEMSNSANLLLNWGFSGRLVDISARRVRRSARFYASRPETQWADIRLLRSKVTAQNAEELFGDQPIDVLMLDIDSFDYWVLKSFDFNMPRLIVVEFQEIFQYNTSVAVDPNSDKVGRSWYFGASLRAYSNLLEPRGYSLVAIDDGGFNAFFVLDCPNVISTIDPTERLLQKASGSFRTARIELAKKQRWIAV